MRGLRCPLCCSSVLRLPAPDVRFAGPQLRPALGERELGLNHNRMGPLLGHSRKTCCGEHRGGVAAMRDMQRQGLLESAVLGIERAYNEAAARNTFGYDDQPCSSGGARFV